MNEYTNINHSDTKIDVVFLTYAPGTNKDEVVYPIFKKKGFYKISIGELIKTEGMNSEFKKEIEESIHNKTDISSNIILSLIKNRINVLEKHTKFLICGFPRSEDNSKEWMKEMKNANLKALIYITYNRKEYEIELNERKSKGDGKIIEHNDAMKRYDNFLNQTTKVFDDFGLNKLIRVSSQLADNLIISNISHNKLIANL